MSDVGINIKGTESVSNAAGKAGGALNRLNNTSDKASGNMTLSWKDTALAITSAYMAFTKIKALMDNLIGAFDKQVQAETKVTSALKATGNVAHFTEKQLKDIASGFQDLTTYGDEVVLEAEAIMLTFKNIGHDVFPRAMAAAADLSAMFGQDLTRSSIMLSKALNDPVTGINAMTRVGVSFSAEATEMVKSLVELGDIAAAQAIILQEVEGQVQGTAEAMAKMGTGSLKQLENKFSDLQEEIGKTLVEGMAPLYEAMSEFIDYLSTHTGVFVDIAAAIAAIGKAVIGVITLIIEWKSVIIAALLVFKVLPAAITLVTTAVNALKVAFASSLGPVGLIMAAMAALMLLIEKVTENARRQEEQFNKMMAESNRYYELIEGAQKGTLEGLENYYEAQAGVEKRIKSIRKSMAEHGQEHKAVYEEMLARQQAVLDSINAQIEAEKEHQLLMEAVRGELQNYRDYARAIEIQTEKIAEWEEKLSSAADTQRAANEEFIDGMYEVLEAMKARQREAYKETEEYKKMMEERAKIEEDFAEKVFKLTATRREILAREEAEALDQARKVGAELTTIHRYYSLQRRMITEEEHQAETDSFMEKLRARQEAEETALGFLVQWAANASSLRIALLEEERDAVLKNAREMYNALQETYGADFVAEVQAGESPLLEDEEDARKVQTFLELYKAALEEIEGEYTARLLQAQKEINLEMDLGGSRGVELYRQMAALSQSLLDPVERQRQELENQMDVLRELSALLPSDLDRMTEFQTQVASKIPALLKIIEARLKELADQPLHEAAEKVADILDRFKSPLEKARQALTGDIESVEKYMKLLREKAKLYSSEEEFLTVWGKELGISAELMDKLKDELSKVEKEIEASGEVLSFWDFFNDSLFKVIDDYITSAQSRYAAAAGKEVSGLSAEEMDLAVAYAMTTDILTMLGNAALSLASSFMNLVTSTESFKEFTEDFGEALSAIAESAAGPLVDALIPLTKVILEFVGIIATLAVPLFNMLGLLIKILMPLWGALGNALIELVKVVLEMAPFLFYLAQLIGQILTPILGSMVSVLSALGRILEALQPVFDMLGYAVDGVARVIMTLWAVVDFIISPFIALGELLFYIITFQWHKIKNIDVVSPGELMKEIADIWKESWGGLDSFQEFTPDLGTVPSLNPEEQEDLTESVYGGDVTVQRVPDIYIYQYFNAPIIGAGSSAEVGEYVVGVISDYLGMGGRIPWEEAP